jgi:hypothetical protein
MITRRLNKLEEYGAKVTAVSVQGVYEIKREKILFTISQLERTANALNNVFENFSENELVKETLEGCFNSTQIKLLTSQCEIRNLLSVMHNKLSNLELDQVIELDKKISERRAEGEE